MTFTLEYFGAATQVDCPVDHFAWLREFFEPSFQCENSAPIAEKIQLTIDPTLFSNCERQLLSESCRDFDCFTLDGEFERFPGQVDTDGGMLLFLKRFGTYLRVSAHRDRIQLISRGNPINDRLALMRVVRELATVRALRRGAIPFHGSACVIEGVTVAFLGSKTAGKSTALVHCLQSPRFHFLANDRFFLTDSPYGPSVTGMPTIVKIRRGTLDLFGDLKRLAFAQPYHRARTLREVHEQPGPASRDDEAASFSQAQFLHLTNSRAATLAPLGSFLFLERDDTVGLPRLNGLSLEDAAEGLRESLLTPGAALQTSEVFDADPNRTISEDHLRSVCRKLAANGYCYRYRQGIHTISQPALPQLSFRAA